MIAAVTTSPSTPSDAPSTSRGLLRYGIEAPYVPAALAAAGLVSLVLAIISNPWWLIPFVLFIAQAVLFLYVTVSGKLTVWDGILDDLHLAGTENALDLGCGRGPVLLALARRLPKGHAVGVDLWRSKDQSGNAEDVTLANASADGLADRIELHTADMTALPFPDASFDIVASALAVHNIPTASGRQRAIDEAYRVLRHGGRLVVVDFRHTGDYAKTISAAGAIEVGVRSLGPRYWYGGPWAAASLVTATRP